MSNHHIYNNVDIDDVEGLVVAAIKHQEFSNVNLYILHFGYGRFTHF
jgi:hypothetical protein